MPSDFHWQAEDDSDWEEKRIESVIRAESRRGLRILLIATIVTLLAVLVIILMLRSVNKQIEATTSSIEQDVISTHELVTRAAEEQDAELLTAFLSGRSDSWGDAQLALIDTGQFTDRSAFGLTLVPGSGRPISVTMSSNLREAELVEERVYKVQGIGGSDNVVRLNHPFVYRQSSSKWLLSPPRREYWGEDITLRGRFLNLTFPERDEVIGRRLAADLEEVLASACASYPVISCPRGTPLRVELSSDPTSLVELGSIAVLGGVGELQLPSPSLVGLPVDEEAYRHLRNGYASQVISRQILSELDYVCCRRGILVGAFVDLQLFQSGLSAWPLTPDDYASISENNITLQHVGRLFQLDGLVDNVLVDSDEIVAGAFAGFVHSLYPNASMEEMLYWLFNARTLEGWLFNITPNGVTSLELEARWKEYIENKAHGLADSLGSVNRT